MSDTHESRSHPHDDPPRSRALPVIEEPLDPANQSLADALRASFRVLKLIMIVLVIAFLASGLFIVDQNSVVVVSRFGQYIAERPAGLHIDFPYPITEKTEVRLDTRTVEVRAFWMKLTKDQEVKPLSELFARSEGLQPGVDGALLTAVDRWGDQGGRGVDEEGAELVHVKWNLAYRINVPLDFVSNVTDEQATIMAVFEAACVSMAARHSVDDIAFTNQSAFRTAVLLDAQRRLDALKTGIHIDTLDSVPYQPLQVRAEFNNVITAENKKRTTIQAAEGEARKVLTEAAGDAYEDLVHAIRALETARNEPRSADVIAADEARINDLLQQAMGSAGETVRAAKAQADQIVLALQADAETLRRLRPKYEQNPMLLTSRLWEEAKRDIFESSGVMRFFVPEGMKRLVLWINRDPQQLREQYLKGLESSNKDTTGQPTPPSR